MGQPSGIMLVNHVVRTQYVELYVFINLFHITGLFLYQLKTETRRFLMFSGGYRKRTMTWDGFRTTILELYLMNVRIKKSVYSSAFGENLLSILFLEEEHYPKRKVRHYDQGEIQVIKKLCR